jgi:hypothetical protein
VALTPFFYNKSIRRIVVLFGTLFNDYYITKTDGSKVKVPISWSSKSKWFVKLKDSNLNEKRAAGFVLPRMGFIITNIQQDLGRKTSSLNQFPILDPDDHNSLFNVNFPTPITLDFSLYIASKTIDEGLQIVEQIVPYFDPTLSVSINELDGFDILRDIPITLNGVQFSDEYEGNFDGQEVMIWDLSFTVESYLYKNITSQSVIKKVVVDLHINSDANAESFKDRLIQQVDPFTALVTDEYALLESWNLVSPDAEAFVIPLVETVVLNDSTPSLNTPVLFTVAMDSLTAYVHIEFNNDQERILMTPNTSSTVFTFTHPGVTEVSTVPYKIFVNKQSDPSATGSFTSVV